MKREFTSSAAQDESTSEELDALIAGLPIDFGEATLEFGKTGDTMTVSNRGYRTVIKQGSQVMVTPAQQLQLIVKKIFPSETEPLPTDTSTGAEEPKSPPRVEFINASPPPSIGLARILSQDREVRRRALEWQAEHGNAVEGLTEFIHNLVGDDPEDIERWEKLVDEPY